MTAARYRQGWTCPHCTTWNVPGAVQCFECERFRCGAVDEINHPAHYTRSSIETMDAIEAWELDFARGNVIKYVSRAGHKNDELEDLKKARWYLNRAIERIEGPVNDQ